MFVRLKELRNKNNYSQSDIAKILNITRPLYSLYETGKREMPVKFLSILAKLYNTSIDYIVGDTDKIRPSKKN
jgi:transcriptional regulator with XRE-family HTH domain